VSFDGHNLHAEYASLRHRIGLVPQDDVVHHQLTLEAALRYAAELRLPADPCSISCPGRFRPGGASPPRHPPPICVASRR
jgi:hypothetical protein